MPGPANGSWVTYALLTITSLIWGANYVGTKLMLTYLAPLPLQLFRMPLGVLVIGVVMWRFRAYEPLSRRSFPLIMLSGILSIVVLNNLFLMGVNQTSATNASLVMALTPLLTAMIASQVAGESLRATQWLGLLLSFSGVAALILMGSPHATGHFQLNPGDPIMVGSMLTNALNVITLRKIVAFMNPLAATFWSTLLGTLVALPLNYLIAGLSPLQPLDPFFWSLVVLASIFSTALGGIWWAQGLQKLGAARTAIFLNAVPLFSGLMAAIFLGEPITPGHLAGLVLIVIGVRMGTSPPGARPALARTSSQ